MYPKEEDKQVAFWENRIGQAKSKLKPYFDAADTLIRQYNNEASSERESDLDYDVEDAFHTRRVKANIVFGWIDQSIANLLERDPVFRITPANKEAVGGERVVSAISNYYYRETNQLHQDERVLLDAFLCPYGVNKIGWVADLDAKVQEIFQEAVDVFEDPEDEEMWLLTGEPAKIIEEQDHKYHIEYHLDTIKELQEQVIDPINTPEQREQVSAQIEILEAHNALHERFDTRPAPDAHTDIKRETPFGIRWLPHEFVVDDLAQDGINDAQWIAFGWELPIEDVKANPNFENTADLEGSERGTDGIEGYTDSEYEAETEIMVRGWELWVKNFPLEQPDGTYKFEERLLTIAQGHKKFLRNEDEWPYQYIENFPVEVLSFQQDIKRWFNKPPLQMAGADTTQALVNEILDSYLYVIRKQKNIWLYDPGSFINEEDVQNILDAPDMSLFPVEGLLEGKGRPIMPLEFASVPNDKSNMLALVQQMMDRAAGTPQPVSLPGNDTATEASIYERRNTSREDRRGKMMGEFQIRKARKFWQLIIQYRPERAFLIDPQAGEWMDISEIDAKGEYMFRIDITSHANALALERKQYADLLNLAAGLTPLFKQEYGQGPNLPVLFERLLVRGYNDHSPEEILPMLKQIQSGEMAPPEDVLGGVNPTNGNGQQLNEEGMPLPAIEGAQQAVEEGRNNGQGVAGPIRPDMFKEEAPSPARIQGDAETV